MGTAEKQQLMLTYLGNRKNYTFVESGTFKGETVEAMSPHFSEVISVELMENLFLDARERFRDASNVRIIHGDSAQVFSSLLDTIHGPVMYWLDGHYSGKGTALAADTQCPILGELEAIIKRANPDDIILIDDARLFGWRSGYPSLKKLRVIVPRLPGHKLTVDGDIIVISPTGWSY